MPIMLNESGENQCREPDMNENSPTSILAEVAIINVGLAGFAEELEENGTAVVQVEWRPPAEGDAELAQLLAEMGA